MIMRAKFVPFGSFHSSAHITRRRLPSVHPRWSNLPRESAPPKRSSCMPAIEPLSEAADAAGQQQLFEFWDELDESERDELRHTLKDVDFKLVERLYSASTASASSDRSRAEPVEESRVLTLAEQQASAQGSTTEIQILTRGLSLVAQGKVAVVCLAGGQGTRLGSNDPKGLFDIGLPSHKSLFHIHAERIQRLETYAAQQQADAGSQIPWVILTSPATDAKTREFFADNKNFGLAQPQVLFAVQGELPCLQENGRIILGTKSAIAKAPDGNGGVFTALVKSGVLEELEKRGVQYIDCYCVDNALARVADPHLAGHADLKQADVCAKALAKAYPEEKVGVFAEKEGSVAVVEYSELDPEEASAPNPATGRLKYNWANISHFCFTPAFIRMAADFLATSAQYHVAKKTIPSVHGPVKGIKLESFIFDPFSLAKNLQLVEVERASHFAPVKNANEAATDTPATARDAVLSLQSRLEAGSSGNQQQPSLSFLRSYFIG